MVTKNVTLDVVSKRHVKDKTSGLGSMINGDFKLSQYLSDYSGETLAGIIFGLLIVLLIIFLLVMLMVFKYKDPNRFNFTSGNSGNNNDDINNVTPGGQGDQRSAVASGYTTVTALANGGTTVTYGSNDVHPPNLHPSHVTNRSSLNFLNRFISSPQGPHVNRSPAHESSVVSSNGKSNYRDNVSREQCKNDCNVLNSPDGIERAGHSSCSTPINPNDSTCNRPVIPPQPSNIATMSTVNNKCTASSKSNGHLNLSNKLDKSTDQLTMNDHGQLILGKCDWSSNQLIGPDCDDLHNNRDILKITVNPSDSLGTTDSSGIGSITGTSSSSSNEQQSTRMSNKENSNPRHCNIISDNCTSSPSTSSIASTAIAANIAFDGRMINDVDDDLNEEEIYSKRPTVKALVIQDALAKVNAVSASPIYESFQGTSRLLHSLSSSGNSECNSHMNYPFNGNLNNFASPYGTISRYNRRLNDRNYPYAYTQSYLTGSHQTYVNTTPSIPVNSLFYSNSILSTNQGHSVNSSSSTSSLVYQPQQQHLLTPSTASPTATSASHLLRMKQLQVQQQQIQHQLDAVLARGSNESPYGCVIRKSIDSPSLIKNCTSSNDVYSVPYGSLETAYSTPLVNSLIKSTSNILPVTSEASFIHTRPVAASTSMTTTSTTNSESIVKDHDRPSK